MLPFVLTLVALGVSFVLMQVQLAAGQAKTRDARRGLATVRVRANQAPVVRRRLR